MSFHYWLMAAYTMYNHQMRSRLADTELTPGQPRVLDYLGECDGASQKEIAAGCCMEPASLTVVLNGMETKGLIERRRLNGNRRSYHIFLTEKGREKQKQVAQIFIDIEKESFAGRQPGEKEALGAALAEIYHTLKRES